MDTVADIRHANLMSLIKRAGGSGALAERLARSAAQVSQWANRSPDSSTGKPRNIGDRAARYIESTLQLPRGWMDAPQLAEPQGAYIGKDANPARYRIEEAAPENDAMPISFMDARGSCGGGAINFDLDMRTPLLKEPGWFRRYRVSSDDCLAVWADGDSMANFIVDGDIVIFHRKRTTPRSGQIYLIQHPDGLRIKRLRREIDGSWVLESDNADKRRFPDERVHPDQAHLLLILGEFLYRQGG
jgi:hypothetical protein